MSSITSLAGVVNPSRLSARGRAAPAPTVAPVAVITGATNPFPSVWSTKFIYVGSVALDWLTLTTFEPAAYAWACRLIEAYTPASDRVGAKWLQYTGFKGDGYFVGMGEQEGRTHYAVRLSGSVAQSFYLAASNEPCMLDTFKCTRADVQYTHNEVPAMRLGEVADALYEADWPAHKGCKPALRAIVDYSTGLDTLYIGRRASMRYQRIYIKPIDKVLHTRWEVEYKSDLAANLWSALSVAGIEVLSGILAGEMAVVPLSVCPELLSLAAAVNAAPERLKLVRDASSDKKRLYWLHTSVLPCVRRLQVSENPQVRSFVDEFLKLSREMGDRELPPPSPGMSMNVYLDGLELVLEKE